jgi:hypothetical protein
MSTMYFATMQVKDTGRTFELTSDSLTGLRIQILGWGHWAAVLTEGMR